MRVAIVIPRFGGGGAEFVAQQWARHLHASGDEVTFLVTSRRSEDQQPPDATIIDVPGPGFARRMLRVRRYMREHRPDVVLALMPYWNLLATAGAVGLASPPKVVVSARNMATQLRDTFGISYRLKQKAAQYLYRRADLFIGISHPVAAEAIGLYRLDPDRVTVVPNPSLKSGSRSLARGDVDAPRRIVVPGRLVPQKRPLLAVEIAALCQTLSARPYEVAFFGVGPLSDSVRRRGADLGVPVVLHGWVEDWSAQLTKMDTVLLPSLSEGFGNVLVEAAAVGVPSVVGTHAMGVADAVIPGVTGTIVPGDSAEDFARAVVDRPDIDPTTFVGWLDNFTLKSSGTVLRQRLLAMFEAG